MDKAGDIAVGFISTIITTIILVVLIDFFCHPYLSLFISLCICLTAGVKITKKENYKNIGVGVITSVVFICIAAIIVDIILSGSL